MHEVYIEDRNGELVDVMPVCSDACARESEHYAGWSGCHELEFTDWCQNCGVVLPGLETECYCQSANVVVNRFKVTERELCEHGNVMQMDQDSLSFE